MTATSAATSVCDAPRDRNARARDTYHKLRDANRALIQQAKLIQKTDLKAATKMYIKAIEAIPGYALIDYEKGLIGKLIAEETAEIGRGGEIEALDRLTICLIKLGRSAEAIHWCDQYFPLYRQDCTRATYPRITKRIEKLRTTSNENKP